MVGVGRPVLGIYFLEAIRRICYNHTYVRHEAGRKPTTDIVGCLIDEFGRLACIRVINEEKSEAIVRIHYLHFFKLIVTFQGNCIKRNIFVVDALDLGRTSKLGPCLVTIEATFNI